MKVITRDMQVQGLMAHPLYETNPALHAQVNFFYFSQDGSLAYAYYESPAGWFDVEVKGFDEVDYVLEGEVELIEGNRSLVARAGDCFQIQDGDKFRWQMNWPSKMIFFIHAETEAGKGLIASFKPQGRTG